MKRTATYRRLLRQGHLLLIAALASCGGADTSGGEFESARWVVEGPVVRIGSVDDSAYAFQSVRALAMSPGGVLHSLHRGEATIRRWDAQGEAVGVVGGKGEGPGEFDTPFSLGFFGDSLWVMDLRAYRVSYFDSEGRFLGTVSPRVDLSSDPTNPAASPPRPHMPLRDGSIYGLAPAWSESIARGELSEARHVLMTPQGDNLGTIWVQPFKPTDILALLRDRGGAFFEQPFGDTPIYFVDAEGALLVLDRRVFEGVGDPVIRLTRIGMQGDTLLERELPYVPEPLPRERLDSAAHAQAEAVIGFMRRVNPDVESGKLEADLRAAMFGPDYLPAVRSMVQAADGSIWIQRFSPSEEGVLWWVLGEDGEPLATAVTPVGLRVLLVSGNALWGVETDEFDVNYIVRYEIRRE